MPDIFKPVEIFSNIIVVELLKLPESSKAADSLQFFIYDFIKISILILCISFFAGAIKTVFSPEKTKAYLSRKHRGLGNVMAALLGVVTPFCSCSACPLFIGFIQAGIPLGITFSFLIAAPMINEMAILLLFSLFGLKITAIYVFSGLTIAIFGGILIGFLKPENYLEQFVFQSPGGTEDNNTSCCEDGEQVKITLKSRLIEAKAHSLGIYKIIWIYVLIAVGIGAWVHNYVPTELLVKYAGAENPFAVPLAVLLGVPLYAGCAGALPIAYVLVQSGMPIGTVLAFTMAVTAISLPEFVILRKVLKVKMILLFAGIISIGIIFTGYLFNFLM